MGATALGKFGDFREWTEAVWSGASFSEGSNLYVLVIIQELCESRGGRPGLCVLTGLLVSVDVKLY